MIRCLATLLLAGSLPLQVSCGSRFAAMEVDPPISYAHAQQAKKLEAEGDALFFKRVEPKLLQGAIKKWQAASQLQPSGEIFVKLSRGHYLEEHFLQGLACAEKALHLEGVYFSKVKEAPLEAVPALFWFAVNLEKVAKDRNGDIKASWRRIKELAPEYFYGGPMRHTGVFEKAVDLAPDYLGNKMAWAEALYQEKKNAAQVKKLLAEILATDPAIDPAVEPENRIEQKRAKKLLKQMGKSL